MTATLTKSIRYKFGLSLPEGTKVEVLEVDPDHENYLRIRTSKESKVIYSTHLRHLKLF